MGVSSWEAARGSASQQQRKHVCQSTGATSRRCTDKECAGSPAGRDLERLGDGVEQGDEGVGYLIGGRREGQHQNVVTVG